MDIIQYNRNAWNKESSEGSPWSIPVSPEVIENARRGDWQVILTPTKAVPRQWFGDLTGKKVLGLASGGGQQVPILAAAGAEVVSYDLSDEQLKKDQLVAEREALEIECVRGDMTDLSGFADGTFDIIFHPVSNCFVPNLDPVWRECHRILKPGGHLLAGFMNPAMYLFNHEEAEVTGELTVRYPLPYSEPDSLIGEAKQRWHNSGDPAQFSHSLQDQIGGQIAAGFSIVGFYEDRWSEEATPLNRYTPTSMATRARKAAS